jgi:hypothetical protein
MGAAGRSRRLTAARHAARVSIAYSGSRWGKGVVMRYASVICLGKRWPRAGSRKECLISIHVCGVTRLSISAQARIDVESFGGVTPRQILL